MTYKRSYVCDNWDAEGKPFDMEFHVFTCDECGKEIDESWPHYTYKKAYIHICINCFEDTIKMYARLCPGASYHLECILESSFQRKKRKTLDKKLVKKVLDKYEHKCVYCGSAKRLTMDHKIPFSRGGPDTFHNLQVLCRSCNSKKSTKTDKEFRALIK